MKKIVAMTKPFQFMQSIYVYDGETLIDNKNVKLDELNQEIFELAVKYEIDEIHYCGSPQFLNNFVNKFKELEIAKYSENKIKIIVDEL